MAALRYSTHGVRGGKGTQLTHHAEPHRRGAELQERREVQVVARQQYLEQQLVSQVPHERGVPLLHVIGDGLAVRDGLSCIYRGST